MGDFFVDNLLRYIGQTVTIFTTSGGLSGNGFTGVLAGVCGCTVKLITDIGAPPACPIGSACDCDWGCDRCFEQDSCRDGGGCACGNSCGGCGGSRGWNWNNGWRGSRDGCGWGRGRWGWSGFNWLGSVTEIPIDRIASFTHNAL